MNIYFLALFTFICSNALCSSFIELKSNIDKLPQLRQSVIAQDIERHYEDSITIFDAVEGAHLPGLGFDVLYQAEKQFFKTAKNSSLQQQDHWLNQGSPTTDFFDVDSAVARQHYVQKLVVPPGAKVLLHGDLHGDVHSLVASIEPYMKTNDGFKLVEDVYLVFLGDYVDKGLYGLECIYVLLRLKIDNPDSVFLVRGNHEDSDICSYYGFQTELVKKGFTQEQIETVYRLYSLLPAALYLGCNKSFVQLCHGGLELGYLPTELLNATGSVEYEWITELNRFSVYSQLSEESRAQIAPFIEAYPHICKDHMFPVANSTCDSWIGKEKYIATLGFMWSDFVALENKPTFYKAHRGYAFNKNTTAELLALTNTGSNKLCGILRAHQHNVDENDPMMRLLLNLDNKDEENKGIAKLWSSNQQTGHKLWHNIVVTFNLSPNTIAGPPSTSWPGFDFDTIGELCTAEEFCDWTLRVHRFNYLSY